MPVTIDTKAAGKVDLTAEVGKSTAVGREFDADLRGTRGVKIYDEMRRRDPDVATGLRAIRWVLGQVGWRVDTGGGEQSDEEAKSFLESCLEDMSHTWRDFIDEALTCLPFGWAWHEVVYKIRNGAKGDPMSLYDDGRLGWRKIPLMPQSSLARWELDAEGGVKAMVQFALDANPRDNGKSWERVIPIEKSVLFRLDRECNDPEGVSLLGPCYLPWYKKKMIEEIEAIGIERDLTGVLIIHLPVNATQTDKDKAVDLLEQFKADDMTGFVAPRHGSGDHEKWGFEIINSPGSKSIDTDKVISRYQMAIVRSFLAQFLMLGQGSAGSWALSRDHRGMFELALSAILRSLEETVNRFLVPPLFRYNDFGQLTALPQLRAGRVGKADMDTFGKMLADLVGAGVLTPDRDLEVFVREEMELPALAEAAPKETPEETGRQAAEPMEGLPDPDDDALWERLERESDQEMREAERRTAAEILLRFARPYNYERTRQRLAEVLKGDMQGYAGRLRAGEILPDQWSSLSVERLRKASISGYRLGVAQARGIVPSKVKLTKEQRRGVVDVMRDQERYFGEFEAKVLSQWDVGEAFTTAVDARAGLYSGTVRSASMQAQAETLAGVPLQWVRHKQDSCETCLANEGKVRTGAAWQAGGVLPAHGTKCNGNCGCSLVVATG